MPKQYPRELRERAVRLVAEHLFHRCGVLSAAVIAAQRISGGILRMACSADTSP